MFILIWKSFKLKEHGTDVRTEVVAGITTFMTMAYILIVNPNILSATEWTKELLFTATALSAAFATIVMHSYKLSYCSASGMGLNAYLNCSYLIAGGNWELP